MIHLATQQMFHWSKVYKRGRMVQRLAGRKSKLPAHRSSLMKKWAKINSLRCKILWVWAYPKSSSISIKIKTRIRLLSSIEGLEIMFLRSSSSLYKTLSQSRTVVWVLARRSSRTWATKRIYNRRCRKVIDENLLYHPSNSLRDTSYSKVRHNSAKAVAIIDVYASDTIR